MLLSLVVFWLSLLKETGAAGILLPRGDGVVRLPVQMMPARRMLKSSAKSSAVDAPPSGPIFSVLNGTIYVVQIQLGSPLQTTYSILDTGSNEWWVDPNCDLLATEEQEDLCSKFARYDPEKSSSAESTSSRFEITYGIGQVEGFYWKDTVTFAGANLQSVQFGVASNSSDIWISVMGLCFGYHVNTRYRTLIDELQDQGYIKNKDFAVALGAIDDARPGEIVFGGVDTFQYSGGLSRVPIIFPGPDHVHRYWVRMDYVGITVPGSCDSLRLTNATFALPVIVDSGTTLNYIPQSIINKILAYFPSATFNASTGLYSADCDEGSGRGTVEFGFGGARVRVPYMDMIWEYEPGSCALTFQPSLGSTINILGAPFMRAAYVLFRQDEKALYMGQFANCGNRVAAINATGALPTGQCVWPTDAVPTCSGSGVQATSTASSVTTTTATTSATTTSTAASSAPQPSTTVLVTTVTVTVTVGRIHSSSTEETASGEYSSEAGARSSGYPHMSSMSSFSVTPVVSSSSTTSTSKAYPTPSTSAIPASPTPSSKIYSQSRNSSRSNTHTPSSSSSLLTFPSIISPVPVTSSPTTKSSTSTSSVLTATTEAPDLFCFEDRCLSNLERPHNIIPAISFCLGYLSSQDAGSAPPTSFPPFFTPYCTASIVASAPVSSTTTTSASPGIDDPSASLDLPFPISSGDDQRRHKRRRADEDGEERKRRAELVGVDGLGGANKDAPPPPPPPPPPPHAQGQATSPALIVTTVTVDDEAFTFTLTPVDESAASSSEASSSSTSSSFSSLVFKTATVMVTSTTTISSSSSSSSPTVDPGVVSSACACLVAAIEEAERHVSPAGAAPPATSTAAERLGGPRRPGPDRNGHGHGGASKTDEATTAAETPEVVVVAPRAGEGGWSDRRKWKAKGGGGERGGRRDPNLME